jgi:nitrate reductase cytochrome c-type subunit
MHLVHVEDLDGFYRKKFDPAVLATTTVYRYQCAQCHSVEFFDTPS